MLLLAAALLTATPAPLPAASANAVERAHKVALDAKTATREAASAAYHWATHSVTLDRAAAGEHAAGLARQVAAADEAFATLSARLTERQARRAAGQLATAREALVHARATVTQLEMEAARPAPSRTEVRALTAELYGTLTVAVEAQQAIGKQLKPRRTTQPGPRGR